MVLVKRSSAHIIKVVIIFFLLLIQSIVLSSLLIKYATSGNFTPDVILFVKAGALMLLLSYTHSMIVGAWGGWEQYVVVPLSISLGIAMGLVPVNPIHARNMGLLSLLFILYFSMRSIALRSFFVKFYPRLVLRRATTGIILVFSIMCASVVLIYPEGKHVTSLEKTVTDSAVNLAEKVSLLNLPETPVVSFDIEKQLHKEIQKTIEPYRSAIAPAMALVVFSVTQALGTIVFILYSFTADLIFYLAKKTKFIKLDYIPVQQEKPTF